MTDPWDAPSAADDLAAGRSDERLRGLRASGRGWKAVAAALGVSVDRVKSRARTIGAAIRAEPTYAISVDGSEIGGSTAARLPLRAGHPVTWGAITARTSFEGAPWPDRLDTMGFFRRRES